MKTIKFEFSELSHYRSELMGYAILGVMTGHFLAWNGIDSMSLGLTGGGKILFVIPFLIHTSGFLFLSGLGLYYSFCKIVTY